jgi:hypothetical protein
LIIHRAIISIYFFIVPKILIKSFTSLLCTLQNVLFDGRFYLNYRQYVEHVLRIIGNISVLFFKLSFNLVHLTF